MNDSSSSTDRSPADAFADRVTIRTRELGHPLAAGIDPHLDLVPAVFRRGAMLPDDHRTIEVVESFLNAFVDRIAERVVVFKPQAAFFELLGWKGLRILESVVRRARKVSSVPILLDAKRGDIGSTAGAYARAYLRGQSGLDVDAMTINPYLGLDSLSPFVETAVAARKGVFILVKTSNPGSGDLQDLTTTSGDRVFRHLAGLLAPWQDALEGPQTGWSGLGVVVGATYPEIADQVREVLPRSLFLIPGFGQQGGSAAAALRPLQIGPSGSPEGGVVNSSRGLMFPPAAQAATSFGGWEQAIDDACSAAIDQLVG